jgi:hypothetical protein
MANMIIHWLDMAQDVPHLFPGESELLRELKSKVLGLVVVECTRRRQASRMIWLKERDTCTWFFHLKVVTS